MIIQQLHSNLLSCINQFCVTVEKYFPVLGDAVHSRLDIMEESRGRGLPHGCQETKRTRKLESQWFPCPKASHETFQRFYHFPEAAQVVTCGPMGASPDPTLLLFLKMNLTFYFLRLSENLKVTKIFSPFHWKYSFLVKRLVSLPRILACVPSLTSVIIHPGCLGVMFPPQACCQLGCTLNTSSASALHCLCHSHGFEVNGSGINTRLVGIWLKLSECLQWGLSAKCSVSL